MDQLIKARIEKGRTYQQRLQADFQLPPYRNHSRNLPLSNFVTSRQIRAGLGNFMLQFASLIGVAYKNDRIPILNRPEHRMTCSEGMDLEVINVNTLFLNTDIARKTLGDHSCGVFTPSSTISQHPS